MTFMTNKNQILKQNNGQRKKNQVEQSDRWNYHYPKGADFDDKHAK